MLNKWNYSGDGNLEHGGFYWRQDNAKDNWAYCVEVVGSSAFGGPDNIYLVQDGIIYIPDDDKGLQDCLDVCGYKLVEYMRQDRAGVQSIVKKIHDGAGGVFPLDSEHGKDLLIDAVKASKGVETDKHDVVQVGQLAPDADDYAFEPTVIIHGNNDLRNYIERTYL